MAPDSVAEILKRMGSLLGGMSGLTLEWSLTLTKGQLADQDRFTCWVANAAQDGSAFKAVGRLLHTLGTPADILEKQRELCATSTRQGLGFAIKEDVREYRLYIQHNDVQTHKPHYVAYRWGDAGDWDVTRYRYSFFPETPQGQTPLAFADPVFHPVLKSLLAHERLRQTSGFWLRDRDGAVDQLDLIFPWQPLLGEWHAQLLPLCSLLNIAPDWLQTYQAHPIRHIAFSKTSTGEPRCTMYFSGPAEQAWPQSLSDLQQQVATTGRRQHETIKAFMSRLPPPIEHSHAHLDNFYSTDDVSAWRTVLGEEMHYHAGTFDQAVSMSEPISDAVALAAVRRAVQDLYPYLPREGRIYDIGCGWCGPMQMIVRDLRSQVLGITVSKTQYRYGDSLGMQMRYGDAEKTLPPGPVDAVLMMESFCHIREKRRLLKILRAYSGRLVMKVNCQDRSPRSVNFGGTMYMISSADLRRMIEETGWKIIHWRDLRPQAVPSVHVWNERLRGMPISQDPHLETLRAYCQRVMQYPWDWASHNPLIEVVAE